jgi:hypothetical protein
MGIVRRLLGSILLVGIGVLLSKALPDLASYLKIWRM